MKPGETCEACGQGYRATPLSTGPECQVCRQVIAPAPANRRERIEAWGPVTPMEPELVGKIPVRMELTVLSADDPKARPLGFTIHEYNGCALTTTPLDWNLDELDMFLQSGLPKDFTPQVIRTPTLREGQLVLAWGSVWIVRDANTDNPYLTPPRGDTLGMLSFNEDDRQCWACTGMANLKAIKRMELTRG